MITNTPHVDEMLAHIRTCDECSEIALDRLAKYQLKSHTAVTANDPFVVSFLGRFKTGKSSLINALIGHEILPTRATTATAVVTRIVKGETTKAWLYEKGKKQLIAVPKAQEIILNYRIKENEEPPEIIFELPISWLPNDVVLVDTPGMDDSAQNGALEKIALDALDNTDLCVCVFDAGSFLSGKERPRTKEIHQKLGGNVVYAVNCINRLNSAENMQLVEDQAKLFFSPLKSSVKGLGQYYMICSAPGNLYLNGFDTFMQLIVGPLGKSQKAAIRSSSAKGQLKMYGQRTISALERDESKLSVWEEDLKRQRNAEMQQQRKQIMARAKEKADYIKYTIAAEAVEMAIDISGLKDTLDSIYKNAEQMGKYSDYSSMSEAVTKSHFRKKFNDVCRRWGDEYQTNNYSIIESAISRLQFPEKHFVDVAATNGDRATGGILGGLIGTIFAPGIGTVIGAGIGGMIGNFVKSSRDDSIENTMTFVQNSVIPLIRTKIEEISRSAAERYLAEAEQSAAKSSRNADSLLKTIQAAKTDFHNKTLRIESMMRQA